MPKYVRNQVNFDTIDQTGIPGSLLAPQRFRRFDLTFSWHLVAIPTPQQMLQITTVGNVDISVGTDNFTIQIFSQYPVQQS